MPEFSSFWQWLGWLMIVAVLSSWRPVCIKNKTETKDIK